MSLVLDFLKGIASPFEYLAKADIINPARELLAGNDPQKNQNALQQTRDTLNLGQSGTNITGALRKFAGNTAQIGLDVVGGELAGGAVGAVGAEGATGVGASTLAKVGTGIVKGAVGGAAVGGAQGVAQGVGSDQPFSAKNLTMDFLSGAKSGAEFGGVVGGAIPTVGAGIDFARNATPLGVAGSVPNPAGGLFSDEQLAKMAKSEDPKEVEKILEPITGPQVAKEAAPGIAADKDVNTVKNQIDNVLAPKIAPAVPSPDQLPLTPATPTSNVVTPAQEAQTASTAALNNPSLHLPGQNVYAELTPEQQAHLSNETANIPVSEGDIPHLTGTDILEKNGAQKVSQEEIASRSPNAAKALAGVPNPEQASLDATAPPPEPKSFMNAPGEEPQGTHVNQLAAMTEMHDMLNAGETPSDALQHYRDLTGADPESASRVLQNLMNDSSVDKANINSKANPQSGKVSFPDATPGDKDTAITGGQYAHNKLIEQGRPALGALQGLNEHDQELTRHLKGNNPEDVIAQADDKEQFTKYVEANKNYLDYAQAGGAELGQNLPYRQQYGGSTPYEAPSLEEETPGQPKAGLPTDASYTKARYFKTHQEALDAGYTPRNASAVDDLVADINKRAGDQSQLALAKGMEQAYPGQVKILNQGQIPAGYEALQIPGGKNIFMPSDIARDINNRAVARDASGVLGKYDSINSTAKNLKLGGGLFHSLNTLGNFLGQQLTSGEMFKNPKALGNVIKGAFSDSAASSRIDELSSTPAGGLDANHSVVDGANATGLMFTKTGVEADVKSMGKLADLPILKQLHESVFGRQIPLMKLETFAQKTDGLDIFGNAVDREAAIKISKEINQQYGGLNRAIQGLTDKQFKLASRFFLSADYQEGQIRSLVDAFSKGGADGKLAREAVFGKALLFGGLATIGGAAGGEFKNQTPEQVALAIMHKFVNPSFDIAGYKVGLPATQISNVVKPLTQTATAISQGKNPLTGVENFASSHLAAVPSDVEQVAANKNFAGNAIYGTDYYGRPITPGQTAGNLASAVLPIPAAQGIQTATGNQSTSAAIANTLGLNVTRKNNLNYAPIQGQTYVQALQAAGAKSDQLNADTEFFDLLGQGAKGRKQVLNQAETAVKAGDTAKAQQVINDFNKNLLDAIKPWQQEGNTQYLDPQMIQILRTAMLSMKTANSGAKYLTKSNPTSIGVPIDVLAAQPQVKNNVRR